MPSAKRKSKSAKRGGSKRRSKSRSRSPGGRKKWKRYAAYGALAGALGGGGYAAYHYRDKIFNLARAAGLSSDQAKAVAKKARTPGRGEDWPGL